MAGIHVYNKKNEEHTGRLNFYIGRGSVLGNPYTYIKDKQTKAKYVVKDRDTAIAMYSKYFDVMYGTNIPFTKAVDQIYNAYKSGEDVWLECYCKPLPCHGDIIAKKLMQRLVKEKINGKKIQQANRG
jgi:hypothetical protein